MAAILAVGIKPEAHLRRLAVVFSVALRLRIVGELYTREMSPKQFHEEFGGGSISRVTKNFKKLEKAGWLRLVRSEGPGGHRRGGIEHFYRATEPAFFDGPSWALVPYSLRVACSWNMFEQIALRVRTSLDAAAAETPAWKPNLSCSQLLLDEVGWGRAKGAIERVFSGVFEEQRDAQIRAARSKELLKRADVLLIVFESPDKDKNEAEGNLIESEKEPLIPFPERLAPVLADKLSRQIVQELNSREMSIPQFHKEFGTAPLGGVRRRFKRLETAGWLRKSRAETGGRRRGATEYFYRATKPKILDRDAWTKPSDSLKGSRNWKSFERFSEAVMESMLTGTFDRRLDRYVTLSFLRLDKEGWRNVGKAMEELAVFLAEEQRQAGLRMAESGEAPIKMTFSRGAFEAPSSMPKDP